MALDSLRKTNGYSVASTDRWKWKLMVEEICLVYLSCFLQNIFVECRFLPKFTEKELQYPDDGSQMTQKEIRNLLIHMRDTGQTFKRLSRRAGPAPGQPGPPPIPGQKYQLPIMKVNRVPNSKAKRNKKLKLLRQGPTPGADAEEHKIVPAPAPAMSEQAKEHLVEEELKRASSGRSLMEEEVYIEHKGYNDFLVIGRESDKFIEFVPNSIYYATEKKCANWLNNCNQKGLQSVLLHKITGPYPYQGV